MKKLTALLFALLMLTGLAACSVKDKPIFETENITGITFIRTAPKGRETVVPEEYLDEITQWLGTFKAGKKAGDVLPPGADSISVRIEYSDGTIVENGLSTVVIKNKTYMINYDKEPACWFDLFTNKVIYDRALKGIPAAADAPLEDVLVKSFDLRYSVYGDFGGGSLTVWRYNDTVEGVDLWTQGIITLSADGAVTFEVEHEEIRLLSEYSPKADRSLIPVTEIFEQIYNTDTTICDCGHAADTAQDYRITYGSEEHIAYVAAAETGVDYYDNFAAVQKPAELTEESYTVNGRYYFILTTYSEENTEPESWTVFMFDK